MGVNLARRLRHFSEPAVRLGRFSPWKLCWPPPFCLVSGEWGKCLSVDAGASRRPPPLPLTLVPSVGASLPLLSRSRCSSSRSSWPGLCSQHSRVFYSSAGRGTRGPWSLAGLLGAGTPFTLHAGWAVGAPADGGGGFRPIPTPIGTARPSGVCHGRSEMAEGVPAALVPTTPCTHPRLVPQERVRPLHTGSVALLPAGTRTCVLSSFRRARRSL